ncbi:sensor histidine kinase [Lentzea sp. NPDC006480]|uniref:sensor histidine kinase n=1 Tax=Lentzea sp. NPDC006480 TaxID=3157176 RepID=UPI0033A87F83
MDTLTPTSRVLTWCLHLLVIGLLTLAAVKAATPAVVLVALVLALVYATGPLLVRTSRRAALWSAALGVAWVVLLVLTADAVWLAFPLYFLQLHLLPRRAGLTSVVATAAMAITGFSAHAGTFTPAVAIGPALGAAVAVAVVWGYQALYRESERRRALVEELVSTRASLAQAQHSAGVLAERERLASEIHDTLAQGLSSIQLLLVAASRALPADPSKAAGYVDQARRCAVDNLAEARRFVAALAPPALDGSSLADALERLCATTSAQHPVIVRFHLTGDPSPLPASFEAALLRIAQSALANTVRHARAGSADVTLSYLGDQVAVDVVDDGTGFTPAASHTGFGLPSMRTRAESLGGTFAVESAPGRGTALAARLPLATTEDVPVHTTRFPTEDIR